MTRQLLDPDTSKDIIIERYAFSMNEELDMGRPTEFILSGRPS